MTWVAWANLLARVFARGGTIRANEFAHATRASEYSMPLVAALILEIQFEVP
jgi:hypothetical protein